MYLQVHDEIYILLHSVYMEKERERERVRERERERERQLDQGITIS